MTSDNVAGTEFPRSIGKVAARELANAGYTRFEHLTRVSKRSLLALHGVGPKSLGILEEELRKRGMAYAHAENDMHPETVRYNEQQEPDHKRVCDFLAQEIDKALPESSNKIWHRHPVWFLDGNPTVGYSRQKLGIRLMFWSGAGFDEGGLNVVGKKFKDASVFYNDASEIDEADLRRWLAKAKEIQWDYKNLIRNGRLERLK